jgi:hypothetical protein
LKWNVRRLECELFFLITHWIFSRTGKSRATIEISTVVKKGVVDTWLTLEQAKHGMVHLRLTWLQLSSDKNDLKAALAETQMLRVTDMSTALLTVFIDSAKNLPVDQLQRISLSNLLKFSFNYPACSSPEQSRPVLDSCSGKEN